MSIMQQSSIAQDRALGFQCLQQGLVKLPSVGCFEASDRSRAMSFLNTSICNLPVDVTLALKIGDQENFKPSYISTDETPDLHNRWASVKTTEEAVV